MGKIDNGGEILPQVDAFHPSRDGFLGRQGSHSPLRRYAQSLDAGCQCSQAVGDVVNADHRALDLVDRIVDVAIETQFSRCIHDILSPKICLIQAGIA